MSTPEPTPYDPSPPPAARYGASWGLPTEDITCPSGNLVKVRRPGVHGLVAAGVLDQVDILGNLVAERHVKRARAGGKGKPALTKDTLDTASLLMDPKAIKDLMQVMDKIMCYVVVMPTVVNAFRPGPDGQLHEIPLDERDPGVIYSDSVPQEDKIFLLNYAVGGTRDLAQFRSEFSENLGRVANGQGLELSP